MPARGERPPLPAFFVEPLKQMHGRALELLANRMAIHMNYFARADEAWLDQVVLTPMMSDSRESHRIWEAFTKYGRVPLPDIWQHLEPVAFRRLSSPDLTPEAKRHLAEMVVIIWVWSRQPNSHCTIDAAGLRSALESTNHDIRSSAASRFATFFDRTSNEDATRRASVELWPKIGPPFFKDVWPLEPTLQSSSSARHFAGVPAATGPRFFAEAVMTILPYLQPFEVWAAHTEFGLSENDPSTKKIVLSSPNETLTLLASCISHDQQHGVFGLKGILDLISQDHPDLQADHRMRRLRRLALG